MEITVNINADTLAESINNLASALLIENNNLSESINNLALAASPIEAVAVRTKSDDGKSVAMDLPEKAEPKEEKAEPKDENAETSYKIEDVRAAFSSFAKAKGKDKAKEILAQFNASKVTELKESDYNAVMEVLEG